MVMIGACSDGSEVSSQSTVSGGTAGAPEASDTAPDASSTGEPAAGEPDAGSEESSAGEGTEEPVWPEVPFSLAPIVTLDQPTVLISRPGSPHLWLAERQGRVRLVERTVDSDAETEQLELRDRPVADLSGQVTTDGEGGLLGMVFSADGQRLYLHYTDPAGDSVVSEVPMVDETADLSQERILLQVDQPYSNHNGGVLTFGPDGMLYIGFGDGGSRDDPEGNGQDPTTLLGAILRLDPSPDGSKAYTIPADNPFAGSTDGRRPEIWVWGVRNPWRFSFDASNGDLWIADVGQDTFEEVNRLVDEGQGPGRGANLGWNLMEAHESFSGQPPADHIAPVYAYRHDNGRCSITGGYVYRGRLLTEHHGIHLYSDYCSGEITGLQVGADGSLVANLQLDYQPQAVISFGQGPDGEIYVLEQGGQVSRLEPAT